RRLPAALRLKLQTAYAQAWEALTDTHQTQAMMFVRRMADRLSLEDALARYFHEVAVPVAMRETVRARALLALSERTSHEPAAAPSPSSPGGGCRRWSRRASRSSRGPSASPRSRSCRPQSPRWPQYTDCA